MDKRYRSGFREIQHTADWALQIWAPDLSGLLIQAAHGMNVLMGAAGNATLRHTMMIDCPAPDAESALVGFLNEILFQMEETGLIFDQYTLYIEGDRLQAEIQGSQMVRMDKPIKAVTYHNLKIQTSQRGLEATVVFDV